MIDLDAIEHFQSECFRISSEHGFHDNDTGSTEETGLRLALIHSEVSEALEALRDGHVAFRVSEDGKPEGMVTELADVVIRCFDTAESLGLNLATAIQRKMEYNESRPHKHGRKV